eukprot:507751_1
MLCKTWKYSTSFIPTLKKDWIFNTKQQSSNPPNISLFPDDKETYEYIKLLKWIHQQALVMFMHDYKDCYDNNQLMSSFWYQSSWFLCDPIANNNYKSIVFDINKSQGSVSSIIMVNHVYIVYCGQSHIDHLLFIENKKITCFSNFILNKYMVITFVMIYIPLQLSLYLILPSLCGPATTIATYIEVSIIFIV